MREREWEKTMGWGWWERVFLCFCNLTQIYVYTFTNEKSKSTTSVLIFPTPMAAWLTLRPPPVPDFCNSYLDEWLKFRRSQPESHHSYLRRNGRAVIFWCIACHAACKRGTLPLRVPPQLSLSAVPPFLQDGSRKSFLGWLIRCRGISGDTCEVSTQATQAETLQHAYLMQSVR